MLARETVDSLHSLANALRAYDHDFVITPAHVHGREQSGETEKVVAVQVGDADNGDRLKTLMVGPELVLGSLTAVEQDTKAMDIDQLRAAMA